MLLQLSNRFVTRTRHLMAIAAAILCLSAADAQNDPFAGGDPFGAADGLGVGGIGVGEGLGGIFDAAAPANDNANNNAADEAADQDVAVNPLVDQLMEQARRGNLALAKSINALARIKRWSQADQLLSQFNGKSIPPSEAAAMASVIGPDQFISLRGQAAIGDDARAALDKLAAAWKAQSESPERLRSAIADLNSPGDDARAAATRVVLRGGNVAIAELVAAAVATRDANQRDRYLRLLIRMGDGGAAALRQLALYGGPDVRGNAIASLARIDRDGFTSDLVTSLHAIDATPDERAIAAKAIAAIAPVPPSAIDAIELLHEELRREMGAAQNADQSEQTIVVWNVGPDLKTVAWQPTAAIFAAYRNASDAARRLARVGARSPVIDRDMIAASLAYRAMIDPDWGDDEQVGAVIAQWAPIIDQVDWNDFLTSVAGSDRLTSTFDAVAYEDTVPRPTQTNTAALIAALRLIAARPDRFDGSSPVRPSLIRSGGGRATALVDLAMASEPRVRYEAAVLATTLADGRPYAGSSRVRQTLAEMTRLNDRPTAIIVETRDALALHFEQLLSQMGWTAETVRNVADLRRRIDHGGDVRLVLSKTLLSDLSPIELVDMVRRAPRGGSIPIVFYDDDGRTLDETSLGSKRWAAPILSIKPPATVSALDGVLDAIGRRQRLPELSVLDRQRYRTVATSLLLIDR